MIARLKRIPWFYILFTVYPLLFLWAVNISEIDPIVVIRPFLYTMIGSSILYAILYISFREVGKAALIGTLILTAFFSYGHAYYGARTVPALKIFSHHSTLILIYLGILVLGFWLIIRTKKYGNVSRYLNMVGLILVVIQVGQLSYSYIRTYYEASRPLTLQSGLTVTSDRQNLPDVYFIVLDTYMRADALQEDMGFDNSSFINQLKEMGFYVAQCSRSNYGFTRGSIASVLNMNYLPDLEAISGLTVEQDSFWNIIKNNEVWHQLEGIGYKTVAFQSEYPWLELSNADVFLSLDHPSIGSQYLYPFENMYINTTAGILWKAAESKLKLSRLFLSFSSSQETHTSIPSEIDPYLRYHIDLQLFTLNKLSDIPSIAGPKFVYAQFLFAHGPYVFGPNGEILSDMANYSSDSAGAVGSEADQVYLYGVQYINGQIIPVLQSIIDKSKVPPIIILQGDHGYQDNNPGQYTILNAYSLPAGNGNLYPSITPVNSFRIILNDYFGADYPLLPDNSYDNSGAIPETFPDCLP
jgi:hypothetical protein